MVTKDPVKRNKLCLDFYKTISIMVSPVGHDRKIKLEAGRAPSIGSDTNFAQGALSYY
jgi:hypothetical protein